MEISLADNMGFCFGVRQAIERAEAEMRQGRRVVSLGPLVHNAQETARLTAQGLQVVDDPRAVTSDTVIIRAHGARPEVFATLSARGLRVVDATCPFVKKSQRIAQELAQLGCTLILIGHPEHPEIQGILGYIATPAFVISTPAQVDALPHGIRPGAIAQTTINSDLVDAVRTRLACRYPDFIMRDTVCVATRGHQESARQLAARVDAVVVIGGRHSSNTNRLAEICRQVCRRTYLVETADELTPAVVTAVAHLGITAGASTPDWLITRVVARLQELAGDCAPPAVKDARNVTKY
jgi:(E)-4-hydroxy-3-methyl-but-2-enyl pyrophosphate reductase